MEMSGQLHTPATLAPGKRPSYPLVRRLDGPQNQSRHSGKEKNPCPSWELHQERLSKITQNLSQDFYCPY